MSETYMVGRPRGIRVVQCESCRKRFETARKGTRFCSDRCRAAWHNAERRRLAELGRQLLREGQDAA